MSKPEPVLHWRARDLVEHDAHIRRAVLAEVREKVAALPAVEVWNDYNKYEGTVREVLTHAMSQELVDLDVLTADSAQDERR